MPFLHRVHYWNMSLANALAMGLVDLGTMVGLFFLAIILLILLSASIKVVNEYERAVIFRLGRLMGSKGPGLVIILPIIDRRRIIDLRLVTLDVPKQRIITKDNVTVDVDAIVYFRVSDPISAVMRVKDYFTASALLAQTTLRDVIGQVELDDLLTRREDLNKRIQQILDEATEPWGIKVTTVAIRDVVIPEQMQRAIAKQAEAERERRSRVIIAEGELMAAEKMSEAAISYARNPIALRLRELQTWAEIAREKNMIIVTESASREFGTILGAIEGREIKKRE
jgi:regulator of protease activity HflC (stomatin/prohibitin superfamily)